MTKPFPPPSSDAIHNELLSLVKSVRGQLLDAGRQYVTVDCQRPRPAGKNKPDDRERGEAFHSLSLEAANCRQCPLAQTRKNVVFGAGSLSAQVVFVGEAPGADEDEQGRPFVGKAGQLLTNIITAMGLTRKEVYICNILKCRPPGNRTPLPEEIRLCEPFLKRQLSLIAPQIICALGSIAAKALLRTETPISALRGRFQSYEGIKLMPTYHPAYLLRNPSSKKQVWEDIQQVMKEIGFGEPS
jgi:DNA polymerase